MVAICFCGSCFWLPTEDNNVVFHGDMHFHRLHNMFSVFHIDTKLIAAINTAHTVSGPRNYINQNIITFGDCHEKLFNRLSSNAKYTDFRYMLGHRPV